MNKTIAAFACACALTGAAHAQSYPARPVQIVVPFAPGGSIDVTFRTIGPGVGSPGTELEFAL